MIQRIQTVYLIVALILLAVMFFQPLVAFENQGETLYILSATGIEDLGKTGVLSEVQTYPIAIIIGVMAIINMLSIFTFKKRVLQMRLCVYNSVFLTGSMGMIYFYSSQIANETGAAMQIQWGSALPLVALIFTILAIRGIRKDEKLIRSMDRIR